MGETQIIYDGMIDNFILKEGEKFNWPKLFYIYIYTLNDESGVRYVGQTNSPS